MTVVLSGVAADTTNVSPVPSVDGDGRFSYVPIPERSRSATVEDSCYGDWWLADGYTAADHLEEIRPKGDDTLRVRGDELADWPLHHDPNFDAATYGERRGAYTRRLLELEAGDVVAFYTGLRRDGSMHRYLIGYIEVERVYDVDAMEYDRAVEVLMDNPENAHTKRWQATGEVDSGLTVADGSDARLLDRGRRISVQRDNGHYYLDAELETRWRPRHSGDGTAYLGGVKQAHLLDVDGEKFQSDVVNQL